MALVLQEREEDWDNHKLTGDPFFKFSIMTDVMHVGSFDMVRTKCKLAKSFLNSPYSCN